MRQYEIRQEADGFQFLCRAVPPEIMPDGYHESFVFTCCTEADSHMLAVQARMREDMPLFQLFDLLSNYPHR